MTDHKGCIRTDGLSNDQIFEVKALVRAMQQTGANKYNSTGTLDKSVVDLQKFHKATPASNFTHATSPKGNNSAYDSIIGLFAMNTPLDHQAREIFPEEHKAKIASIQVWGYDASNKLIRFENAGDRDAAFASLPKEFTTRTVEDRSRPLVKIFAPKESKASAKRAENRSNDNSPKSGLAQNSHRAFDAPIKSSPAPRDDDIEQQKRLMREHREMVIKHRMDEEAWEEAERKERIRVNLESMGPLSKQRNRKDVKRGLQEFLFKQRVEDDARGGILSSKMNSDAEQAAKQSETAYEKAGEIPSEKDEGRADEGADTVNYREEVARKEGIAMRRKVLEDLVRAKHSPDGLQALKNSILEKYGLSLTKGTK